MKEEILRSQRAAMSAVPRAGIAEVQRMALDLFGITAEVVALPGERDANFLLTPLAGDRMVLKIANREDGLASVDLQQSALSFLHGRGLTIPRLVATSEGAPSGAGLVGEGDAAAAHAVWAMTFVAGAPLARIKHRPEDLLHAVGRAAGGLNAALAGFEHPLLHRPFHWDLRHGVDVVREYRPLISDDGTGNDVDELLGKVERALRNVGPKLPVRAVHNDLNDHNLLVRASAETSGATGRIGIVDFGDMVHSYSVSELAVTLAYVMLDQDEPLASAASVVRGYNEESPLGEDELSALFALVCLRMCMSLAIGAFQKSAQPGNEYLDVSTSQMRRGVRRMLRTPFGLAEGVFRGACGMEPSRSGARVRSWLASHTADFSPVLDTDLRRAPCIVLDLGVGSPLVSSDPRGNQEARLTRRVLASMRAANVRVSVGQYDEARLLYVAPFFSDGNDALAPRRTVHIGLDLFADAGTPVHAPFTGTVHTFANNATVQDYGPVIVLRHVTGDDVEFFTLYGHLSTDSLIGLATGKRVEKGEQFAKIGTPAENVGWTPHLHLQVMTDMLDMATDFPGVGQASLRNVWRSFCPDPNLIVGVPDALFPKSAEASGAVLRERRLVLGRNVKTGYTRPVDARRGWMQYLYDGSGRRFLDGFNNVPHVGHSHPRVVRAATDQLAVLNTNTRYPHEVVTEYARRLSALMPAGLEVCYFVNSGSEANELAIRLARAFRGGGRRHTIVLDGAYHGNTNLAIDLSPYKHNGPGGRGAPDWVHVVAQPDTYRGKYRADDPVSAQKYADEVAVVINDLTARGEGFCAFLAETCPSVGGQIIPPRDYFREVYAYVRGAGGVCIADEVQTGFGRMGENFWAFERYDVVPDIVVLGKPIGNGYPIGAVVTTREIADAFDNGMEFFSTFGGSTASCAVGLAVLDVVRDEQLQSHAQRVGARLGELLREVGENHEIVGDVRGSGLFWGVELVRDRTTLEPAAVAAANVVERMRERGVLIGTDGPFHNVLKIRPPMPFDEGNAVLLAERLDTALRDYG